jgi:hypothetical protein
LVHLGSPVYGKVILHLPTISRIKASLHHVDELKLEDIHVVQEFSDVFPDDVLGMPPEREIEFKIECRRLLELIKDYELEVHYHPGKANIIADVLSRKAHYNYLPTVQLTGEESNTCVLPLHLP